MSPWLSPIRSQTALRDVIGKTKLLDMLEGRDKIGSVLQKIIDERTEPWGINVVIVPSTAVESMQLGGLAGLTALTMGLGQERANGQKEAELKRMLTMEAGVRLRRRERSIGEAWKLDEEKKKMVSSLEHATGRQTSSPNKLWEIGSKTGEARSLSPD